MVIHVLLLFKASNWMLLSPMSQGLEGVHVGFLRQVTKLKTKRLRDGSWRKVAVDRLI